MKNISLLFCLIFFTLSSFGQCEVYPTASQYEIYCGQSVTLTAFGQSNGTVVLTENFDSGGFGPGWGSTPGSTSFTNPCSPGGVDGTPHAWMDNNTTVPRTLQSAGYDLTAATAGVTICFDLLFATQGEASPCEGPDEPDEGVYLEYSIDGGATWIQIHYFDPNGGYDPQLTNWNNYCFQIPLAAITANTIFRWHQTADSGAAYDHWGIDNVEIFQNDVNAELEWLHDGYSYGVGNPGGDNPTDVSPTSTTTYTAQLTTGSGTVCTQEVTITVLDPIFDITLEANPNPVCEGECTDITGNALITIDPGGDVTYENNEFALIFGTPALPAIPFVQPAQPGEVESNMNINVVGINQPTVTNGLITSICINQYAITAVFGGGVNLSTLEFILSCPDGTSINLVNVGDLSGNTITNLCFELGAPPLSTGTAPYSGTFAPAESWAALNGCSANGVWNLTVQGEHTSLDLPIGGLTGWLINFDNPPVYQDPFYSWSPALNVSDPSSANPNICPTETTTYTLEVSNGIPGCIVHSEDITITVDPCTGCTPPVLDIDPITVCSPNDANLNDAINATSDPATISFHNTQADAQNDFNAIGNLVGVSGSYWVRAEDPLDPTCFEVFEIDVTIITVTFDVAITDENCGNLDGELDLTGLGGTAPYIYSIDNGTTSQGTGLFPGLSAGSYDILITDDNGCEITGTAVINNVGGPTIDLVTTQDPSCVGDCDGEISVTVSGGTAPYTYQWLDNGGNPIGADSPSITNLCAGDYSLEVNDASAACVTNSNATLTNPAPENPSFTLTDFCEGTPNNAVIIGDAGGTFAFNPEPGDGSTINSVTGEITNGVNGTTYTVEYITGGACPESSTETVSVTGFTFNSNIIDENCGSLDGEIELIPNGGTAPYNYSINNGTTFQGSETFSNVAAGVYNVVVVDDNGCEAIGTVNVSNVGGPSINQLTPTNPSCNGACDGEITVVATGGTLPYSYQWFDAGGNPIGADLDLINGLCAGDYSVQVSDAGALCPVTSSTTIVDPVVDDASFTLTDFCEGEANMASGITTPGGTFTFSPAVGDGASIDASTGEIINGVGGTTYSVQYETSGSCPQISVETVTVIEAPSFILGQTDPSCGGTDGEIIISDLLPNTTYGLTYNDGAIVGPQNLTSDGAGVILIQNLSDGAYSNFELTINGCTSIDNSILNLVQAGAPSLSAPADLSICIGESVTLTATNPDGAVISWDSEVVDSEPFTPGLVGAITYTVTADLNGCSVSDEVVVNVNPLPVVDAGADASVCSGDNVILNGSGAQSYVWDNGAINGVGFVPDNTTTYTVIGTDVNGCVGQDDVLITVNELPSVDFTAGPLTGCSPLLVDFENLSGANNASCTWDLGDGNSVIGCDNFSHVYQSEGSYSVTLNIESIDGCTNSLTINNYITVTAPPVAMFSADPQVTDITNTFINFTNESIGGENFTWNFGDGSDDEFGFNASHEYTSETDGMYIVTLVASNGPGCSDTVQLLVKIDDILIFYVPNTFTPDTDIHNPIFIPIFGSGLNANDYKLLIFNRWGEVVFETKDVLEGWDGTYKGQPVKDGAYVWTLEFSETMSDKRHVYNGHVNVLR